MGLIQGGAGVFFVHRQLLAVGGGEGVAAVGVDAHGPDIGLGIAGELAIGQGHVGALVIEAGVLRGQGLSVGRVEYHHLVAVGYGGNDAALLNLEECLGKQSFIAADGAEGTPVVLLGIPLQIAAAAHVLDIVAALGGSLLQCPGGVGLVQGSAGVFFVHGQLLAVGGGEGIAAIVVDAYGPDVRLGKAGQLPTGEGHVGALVIEAGVLAGQGLQVGGVIDDHLVTVLQGSGGIIRLTGLVRLLGVCHQIKLLGKQSLVAADGSVGAPVVLLGEPLQIAAAAHVLDVEAVRRGGGAERPIHIGLVQGGAGVFFVHGQLLAVGGGEGIGAALGAVHGPQLCIRVAGEFAPGQLHIHACVIEAVVHGGQSLLVGGVEHHHLVAVLQGGQIGDDAAFPGGGSVQLIDAGQQHGHVGVRGVVQETGVSHIVQNAAAGRIRAGNGGGAVVIDGDGPGVGALAGIAQFLCLDSRDLFAVGGGQGPGPGASAQRKDFHLFVQGVQLGFHAGKEISGHGPGGKGAVVGSCGEDDLVAGLQGRCVGDQCCTFGRRVRCEYRHRQQGNQHDQ